NIALSFLFLFLILITINDNNKAVFRNGFLSYLGSISYGIYMYHPFVLFLVFPFVNTYLKGHTLFYNLTVYAFVIGLTIGLSHISYKYFELRFIKYKDKKFSSL
ncbi:MAG: acyltransferase family protein, partial [Flavobacterium sp.]